MKIFARNFRGFRRISIDIDKTIFLVGDNSSGKTSILYLVHAVCADDLDSVPKIDEDFGASRYDYFSPYFDDDDVTFGFVGTSDPDQEVAKVITVRKGSGIVPVIQKCSFWIPGYFITVRKNRNKTEKRIIKIEGKPKEKELLRMHDRSGGYEYTGENLNNKNIAVSSSLLTFVDSKDELFIKIIKGTFSVNIKAGRFVSPIRALPERFYSRQRTLNALGSHFATMWMDLHDEGDEAFSLINKFGQESLLFDDMNVTEVSKDIVEPPLFVSVKKNGKDFSLDQVGVGVSQVVPVLMESIYSLKVKGAPLLIQQPELHLHPVAQAAFGSYIYSMSKLGVRGIYETHSSFLIDRFRADLRDGNEPSSAEIIFCQNGKKGNACVHLPIRSDGKIKGEPEEFHNFFVAEFVRTIF